MFMGGHVLQRVADVGKVRGFVWCRKSVGWATSNKLGKRLQDPGELRDPRFACQLSKAGARVRPNGISKSLLVVGRRSCDQ